jgi:ABC-type multidrug transport system ATPase subunit
MDELTNSLDEKAKYVLVEMISDFSSKEIVIYSAHDYEFVKKSSFFKN